MHTLMGMKIVVSPYILPTPRMQCSKEFVAVQSPELVATTNEWMLKFFGATENACVIGDTAFVSLAAFNKLKLQEALKC